MYTHTCIVYPYTVCIYIYHDISWYNHPQMSMFILGSYCPSAPVTSPLVLSLHIEPVEVSVFSAGASWRSWWQVHPSSHDWSLEVIFRRWHYRQVKGAFVSTCWKTDVSNIYFFKRKYVQSNIISEIQWTNKIICPLPSDFSQNAGQVLQIQCCLFHET